MLIKLRTWSCFEIRMQEEITVHRLIKVSLKGWKSSNTWEQPELIDILFRMNLKSSLKSGNTCYYLVQNLLSSSLLSKNLKIKIYRTIILPVLLYGHEIWSFTLREEHRLRLFENGILR